MTGWKVDSSKITNFNATPGELQAQIIFWILAAGKTAKGAERILSLLCPDLRSTPFSYIRKRYSESTISQVLKSFGCGCYNVKGKSIWAIATCNLDLKTCSHSDLEKIYGIGRKSSRAFILHTRKNAQVSVIDTHILKFLKSEGVSDTPKSTPSSKKEYERLENAFLEICRKRRVLPAEYDLQIWNYYSKK